MREVDFTKKRLQQEFEDKLEVEQQNKRQLERRVGLLGAVGRVPGRNWEGLGAAGRPVTGQSRQALGAIGEGWRVSISVQEQPRANCS